jgi:hypothetical protein
MSDGPAILFWGFDVFSHTFLTCIVITHRRSQIAALILFLCYEERRGEMREMGRNDRVPVDRMNDVEFVAWLSKRVEYFRF